jgi:SAM-dependent methyltransferase
MAGDTFPRVVDLSDLPDLHSTLAREERRSAMWHYYDRRVAYREPGAKNVLSYFRGLGASADLDEIEEELDAVCRLLRSLPAMMYLDVGCGPTGEFTSQLPGTGCAIDQSEAALRQLGRRRPRLPLLRADSMRIPVVGNSIGRVFVSHLYGLLLPDESAELLTEVRRVANEMVILDSGRPPGTEREGWQTRSLPDGTSYPIFRRHLDAETLADEIGGDPLFSGKYFVMASAPC